MISKNRLTATAVCLAILIAGLNAGTASAIQGFVTAATANTTADTKSLEDLEAIIENLKTQIQAVIEQIKAKNSTSTDTAASTCIAENQAATDTNLNCCTGLVKTNLSETKTPAGCSNEVSGSTPCTGVTENYT